MSQSVAAMKFGIGPVAGTESDVAAQLAAIAGRVGQVLVHPLASPGRGVDEPVAAQLAALRTIWRSIG